VANITINMTTGQPEILDMYNFGWCQTLNEADMANCTGDFYAGRFDPEGWTNGTTCTTAYSDGSSKNINAAVITNMSVIKANREMSQPLNGTSLTYTHGSICPSTNAARTFTINVLCDAATEADYLPLI